MIWDENLHSFGVGLGLRFSGYWYISGQLCLFAVYEVDELLERYLEIL